MKYETLKDGEVLQEGDEVRRYYGKGKRIDGIWDPNYERWTEWEPTQLVGHTILQSDLMGPAEYRRPLP